MKHLLRATDAEEEVIMSDFYAIERFVKTSNN